MIGWGGSIGHREDLRTISAALIAWLQRQRHVRFELMCDPVLAEPFAALDGERFRFTMAGSLADYLAWLEELDIGLAPLLPAEFNRCRSDVKFLEHASRAVAPVLQNLDSYRHLCRTGAALLFDNIDELIHQLDRLVNEPALRHTIATTAHALVSRPRARWNRCSSRRRIVRSPPCRACASWLRATGAWASTARLISHEPAGAPADCHHPTGRGGRLERSGVRFDPRFAFHYYDLDVCRSARRAGLSLGTWPLPLVHASGGEPWGKTWRECPQAKDAH